MGFYALVFHMQLQLQPWRTRILSDYGRIWALPGPAMSIFIYLFIYYCLVGMYLGSWICFQVNKSEGLWWYFPSKTEIMKGSFLGGATRVICEMGFILQATVVAAMASQQLVWLRPDLSLHCPVHDNRNWILIKMCHLCRIKVVGGPNKMSHAWSTKHNL